MFKKRMADIVSSHSHYPSCRRQLESGSNIIASYVRPNVVEDLLGASTAIAIPQIVHFSFFGIPSATPDPSTPLRTGLPALLSVRKREYVTHFVADMVWPISSVADIDFACGRYGVLCGRYRVWPISSFPYLVAAGTLSSRDSLPAAGILYTTGKKTG